MRKRNHLVMRRILSNKYIIPSTSLLYYYYYYDTHTHRSSVILAKNDCPCLIHHHSLESLFKRTKVTSERVSVCCA